MLRRQQSRRKIKYTLEVIFVIAVGVGIGIGIGLVVSNETKIVLTNRLEQSLEDIPWCVTSDSLMTANTSQFPTTTSHILSKDEKRTNQDLHYNVTLKDNNSNDNNHIDATLHKSSLSSWPIQTNNSWCVPYQGEKGRRNRQVSGLIFAKVYKAASSTGSGITIQIAHHIAKRLNKTEPCEFWWQHGRAHHRRRDPYRLWTWIRNPAKRAISEFFHFGVSRQNITANAKSMLGFLKHPKQENMQFYYLSTRGKQIKNAYNLTIQEQQQQVSNVLNPYHFVGLIERMEESLVVLQLLWGLQDEDVIVLPSKIAGGYDGGGFKKTCFFVQKSFVPPRVRQYLQSEFLERNKLDYMLYDMVNQTLDKTIDMLGRSLVEDKVKRHKYLSDLAIKHCHARAIFPCSANGTRQLEESKSNCYMVDSGCGYPCVQETISKYG